MSTTIEQTVTVVPDRTCRISFEKPYGKAPTMMTVDEKLVDGASTITGNMFAQYDAENPLDVALYTALEAKILSMRTERDAAKLAAETSE